MSKIRKAQDIANMLEEELGFFLASYQMSDLELLRDKLDEFLQLGVETEDLEDPDDALAREEAFGEDDCER
jgi:hypothetical protein